jgi:hypothetical protein
MASRSCPIFQGSECGCSATLSNELASKWVFGEGAAPVIMQYNLIAFHLLLVVIVPMRISSSNVSLVTRTPAKLSCRPTRGSLHLFLTSFSPQNAMLSSSYQLKITAWSSWKLVSKIKLLGTMHAFAFPSTFHFIRLFNIWLLNNNFEFCFW